ncbi:uncharacterized protein LOC126375688 [Pectinophora gossypiella]|uniref:uncharacterized protein LOC126375688 n=1 Tax=Pectinophora gossypiella TaxID=13191 RepID=UPI00214E281C|nr:uncharacterized protein LOC126375688 [Pectinophora gossypiella]
MIQTTYMKEKKETPRQLPQTIQKPKNIKSFTSEVNSVCTYCNKPHYICHCTDFTQLEVEQRKEFAKKNGLCFNCLVKGHQLKNCRQHTSCKICNHKHHTLLHTDYLIAKSVVTDTNDEEVETTEPTQITSLKVVTDHTQVVLATAQVGVVDRNGTLINLRALVDQGSQATFITEAAVQFLGLKKTPLEANVTGIANNAIKSRHIVSLDILSPLDSTHVTQVDAHVLTKLTPSLPKREIDLTQWTGLTTITLSDPHMHKPGPIDVLLGADVYTSILLEGLKRYGSLIAQNSRLGWLVSGTTKSQTDSPPQTIVVSTTMVEMDQLLRKFWEIEEYQPHEKPLTQLEKQCEDHYQKTHTRNEDGRYIVRLPFRDSHEENLGDSRQIAENRLRHMEKRFIHKPKFRQDYTDFIEQYQSLNHMEDVDPDEEADHKVYYLPHHAVIRESSTTTKLRVVFDGSARPLNGTALNDELLIGPALQQDLRDLIIRWRTHKICLLADVKQMYRQILVFKEDVDYQRILWRSSPQDDLVEKRLLTVTYGTSCAPFLAIRTLQQLAQDETPKDSDLFDIINNDFYMDDLLTGASDEDGARDLQKRITDVMNKGKFEMHKWASNSPVVLKHISESEKSALKFMGSATLPVLPMALLCMLE